MWKTAAIAFTIAFLAGGLVMEGLRVVVDRRRRGQNGLGGTQDVAMLGSVVRLACGVLAGVSWAAWFLTR